MLEGGSWALPLLFWVDTLALMGGSRQVLEDLPSSAPGQGGRQRKPLLAEGPCQAKGGGRWVMSDTGDLRLLP